MFEGETTIEFSKDAAQLMLSQNMRERKKMSEVTVTAKCIGCGAKREIKPHEIPKDLHPICNVCYMPMITESVTTEQTPAPA